MMFDKKICYLLNDVKNVGGKKPKSGPKYQKNRADKALAFFERTGGGDITREKKERQKNRKTTQLDFGFVFSTQSYEIEKNNPAGRDFCFLF